MLTAVTAVLLLVAPAADATDRFDRTPTPEAQRAMLASFSTTRELVSGLYNWASSRVTLDRYTTQQQALDISKNVRATEGEWARMAEGLPAAKADQVKGEVTAMRDLFAKAQGGATKLSTEAGATTPSTVEVRYLTSEIYGALALAHEHQIAIGKKLGINTEVRTEDRAR